MIKNNFSEKDIAKKIFDDRWVKFAFGSQGHIKNKELNLGIVEFDKDKESLSHEHEVDEALYVLKGLGTINVGNELIEVRKGDFLYIPKKTNHKIITRNNIKLKILFVFGGDIFIDY